MPRSIHFGVFLLGTGNHTAGWRYPGADQTFLDIKVLQRVAAIAERGLFDFLFLGDGLAANLRNHPSYTCRLEPMTLLSALAMTTTHIGLAATMSTTYSDPYTVARVFASLDHISGGRAACNAVTTSASNAGGNFGRTHPNHELRYEIAEEFISVVLGLWDCWSDKAIIADLKTGKFFDESEVRPLNHQGPHFSVKGPLNTGRCPQGRPLVLQAGGSERGLNLAARTADVVFSVVQDFGEARLAYSDLKERVRRFGRDPDSVRSCRASCRSSARLTLRHGTCSTCCKATSTQRRDWRCCRRDWAPTCRNTLSTGRFRMSRSPTRHMGSPGQCYPRGSARTCRSATSTT
jgi:FMN-dependent oxidoreductase (nitrilotriacetate monooxygenase family)